MLIEQIKTEDNGEIGLWDITEDRDQLLELLNLDPYIMEQVFAFTSTKRQLEFLSVRAMVNQLLGSRQNILYKPNKSPYLETGHPFISITHTGHYAAVYLHPTRQVGVDVERIGDKVGRVRSRFLSEKELASIDPQNEKTQLTILWSAKESIYKAMQTEVVDFANDLHTEPFHPHLSGEFKAWETKTSKQQHFTIHYQVYPDFVMTWTTI